MEHSVKQDIKRIIIQSRYGSVFFVSSFSNFDEEYVTKLLPIFEKEGLLTRISKGVYLKVRHTQFGPVYPPIAEIVAKIAKRDHAVVIPTGDVAANRLGFTTQVPMNPIYLTSGSSRKLKLGKRTVTLKHSSPRNFAYKGKFLSEIIQALSAIGQKNVDDHILERLRQLLLDNRETTTLKHDLSIAPAWIRRIITQTLNTIK